jgi:cytidylate kinase
LSVIAIDGPAGSGKTTVACALADRLGLEYLDTGAMYRAVAFAVLRRDVDPDESEQVARVAASMELTLDGGYCLVDGVDATVDIRGSEVTRVVSIVSAIPGVRAEMVDRQRAWVAARGGGVIEGRDIGSVVFPDADAKVYLTASADVRARRRSDQDDATDVEAVAADIRRRDEADSDRRASPLVRADGAVEIDTTALGVDETVDRILGLLE